MSLADQVILITGGARGIGAETAKALAGKGAKLILTDLDRAALDETAAGARAVLPHVADILPRMDAEVAALGRSTSSRNVDNAADPAAVVDPKE